MNIYGDLRNRKKFAWDVQMHDLAFKQVGEFLTLSAFTAFGAKWQLKVYARGLDQKDRDSVSLVLHMLDCGKTIERELETTILFDCNTGLALAPRNFQTNDHRPDSNTWEFRNLCRTEIFMSTFMHYQQSEMLSIECNFVAIAPMAILNPINLEGDVVFSIGNKYICAHKMVLANKSRIFATIFQYQMRENVKNVIKVCDVEYDIMLAMIHFIYSGTVHNIQKTIAPLLAVANKYEINDLKTHCGEYLAQNLSVENLDLYLSMAKYYNIESLKMKAVEFIIRNGSKIIFTSRILSIVQSNSDVILNLIRNLSERYLP